MGRKKLIKHIFRKTKREKKHENSNCMWCGAQLCPTLYDPVNCSPPLSMEFYRQGCWSGFSFPTPGYLPHSGIEFMSLCLLHWQVGSLPLASPGKPSIVCEWCQRQS